MCRFQAPSNVSPVMSLPIPSLSSLSQILHHLKFFTWTLFVICRFLYFRYPWMQFSVSNQNVERGTFRLGKHKNNLKAFLDIWYLSGFSTDSQFQLQRSIKVRQESGLSEQKHHSPTQRCASWSRLVCPFPARHGLCSTTVCLFHSLLLTTGWPSIWG